MKRRIEVVDYCPSWRDKFNNEKSALTAVLRQPKARIWHIGSTSVAGLVAKPIIDILVGLPQVDEIDRYNKELAKLGYVAKGENGIAGRRYFQKGGIQRSHHMHVFGLDHPALRAHLAFRDYLRLNADIATEYGQIKTAAALSCQHDSNQYMALKHKFVEHHLAIALDSMTKQR